LKGKQVSGYDFHRQKPIGSFIFDFYCPKLELAIELDGSIHERDDIIENDLIKEKYLKGLKISLLRFKNEEVLYDVHSVIETIIQYIISIEK